MTTIIPDTFLSLVAGETALPLERLDITGAVDGTGVIWTVRQTFHNPLVESMEAVYRFPLPVGGSVCRLIMRIGDRTVEADIRPREEARIEYEEAIASGHTAAIAEQDAAEIFSLAVGNIHPGETIDVDIEVHDTVTRDESQATVRMPTLIKPRYVPADMPGSEALSPPRHTGEVHVDSRVRIDFDRAVPGLACTTVPRAVVGTDSVTIEDFSLDRDIVVKWEVATEAVDAKWVPDSPDSDMGTVEVIVHSAEVPAESASARTVVVLLDRSGSMGTTDMDNANRITAAIVNSLSDGDLVQVITFDNHPEALGPCEHGPVPATASARTALGHAVMGVTARGGTELTAAIEAAGAALALAEDHDDGLPREKVVVLLTDGAYGDEATAARQRDVELGGARVIVVGIGQDMNGYLEVLAANGWFTALSASHLLDETIASVRKRLAQPALTGARIDATRLTDQAPRIAPDIYPRVTTTLWGRMPRPAADTRLTVSTDAGELATVPVRISEDSSARTRWAGSHIRSIDWRIMTGALDADEGGKAIVEVSTSHRVLSKYTAWLAIDRSRTTESIVPVRVEQSSLHPFALGSSHATGCDVMLFSTSLSSGPDLMVHDSFAGQRVDGNPFGFGLSDRDDDPAEAFDALHEIANILALYLGNMTDDRLDDLLDHLRVWLEENEELLSRSDRRRLGRLLESVSAGSTRNTEVVSRLHQVLTKILRGT